MKRPTIGIRLPSWAHSTQLSLGGIMDYMIANETWKLETEDNSYGEMESIEIGVGWKGAGVILYRATIDELEYFKANNIAVCLLSTEGPDLGFPRVVPDNLSIGVLAAKHLLETGAQSFGYLARGETLYKETQFAPGDRVYSRERLKGYLSQLQQSDFEPNVFYLKGYPLWKSDSWKHIEKEVTHYIKSLPKHTGLFVVDDALAHVALRAAEKSDVKVPDDLMIIGFGNNINYCYASTPSMSSIIYPSRAIGYEAAKIIHQQLTDPKNLPESKVVNIDKLKQRESTSFIAIPDPEIASLVKWIRLNAPTEAIQVSDLLEHSSYSLSSIKIKFKQYLGHSPKDEIKLARLTHLEHQLTDLNKPLTQISNQMDFRTTEEMSRFFLREKGIRPTTYRENLTH